MRIGIDGRELQGHPTGTGRYLRNLVRVWTGDASDCLVVYFNGPRPSDPVLDSPAVETRPLGERPVRGLLWQEALLPAAARQDRLDVFFAPAYTCPLSLATPRVTTVHDVSFFALPWDFAPLDGLRRRVLVQASIRASREILAVSDFARREILSFFPELAGRVSHVPHGADDDLPPGPSRSEARARLGARGPLLLAVGSILNRRHLPVLLRAVAQLARHWPGLVLDVVGENRTQPRRDLLGLVNALELGKHVRLSGFVDEERLAELYAAADVAVSLSDYEGFGLPALEAAARGLPLVASTRPALGEIFAEAAVLVDPQDPVQVANGIARVLRHPDLREELTARGRTLARRHSWAEAATQTRQVLARAAAS
jgi:glycosyltransferase involved in cell wall biosynthesis